MPGNNHHTIYGQKETRIWQHFVQIPALPFISCLDNAKLKILVIVYSYFEHLLYA